MDFLFPQNITESFISPFNPANDPTNLIGNALVASGGIGPVPFEFTQAAAGLVPGGFAPPGVVFGGDPIFQETINQFGAAFTSDFSNMWDVYQGTFNAINNTSGLTYSDPFSYGNALDSLLAPGFDATFGGLSLVGITPQSLGLGF